MRVMLTAPTFVFAGAALEAPALGPTLAVPPAGLSRATMSKRVKKLQELAVEVYKRGRTIGRLTKAVDHRASVAVARMPGRGI